MTSEQAFWVSEPGTGELRPAFVGDPGPGEVRVRTAYSGVSRGTETLVFRGGVPADQRERMRGPHQEGEFPAPVKYGYLSVGVVEAAGDAAGHDETGPNETGSLVGRTVFCLHPHQTAYVVPAGDVALVPDGVPAERAVLAGTVETAVNALWDAAPQVGDRVAVVGAGMVGCCVARLLTQIPGVEVTLVDVDPARAATAAALGAAFAHPDDAPGGRDLVVHASATAEGLQRSLELLAPDGAVVDLSWYGDTPVKLDLGSAFHAGRLSIRASQVGEVALAHRARRTRRERLELALELLRDPAYDALLTGPAPFAALPTVLADLAAGRRAALCQLISYPEAPCTA